MTASAPAMNFGRYVFAVASLVYGVANLAGHRYDGEHLRYIVYAAAAAQIIGGTAIALRRTATTGAFILGAAYLVFAGLYVPGIVAAPRIYDSWGNFFEQFSLVTGAAIVYTRLTHAWAPHMINRLGRIALGICIVSFTLEQALYLDATARLVPKWLAPSQIFWAIATTVLFALGAGALLTNRKALLAARLLATMLVGFGLLVWIPLLMLNPHSHTNWSETAETFAIAGAAWILADLLGACRQGASSR